MVQTSLIDPPSPFAPKSELQAFLRQHQGDKAPEVQEAVRQVRGYLNPDRKAPSLNLAAFKKATSVPFSKA